MAPSSHNADAFWGITLFLATGFGAAFWPFVGISLAFDTLGVKQHVPHLMWWLFHQPIEHALWQSN